MLFKQLDREGRKPMFMLRRHASPQTGWSGQVGGGGADKVSMQRSDYVHTRPTDATKNIPGGVL